MIEPSLIAALIDTARRDGIAQLVVGAIICDNANVLLLRRNSDDFMGGIFELPSGKVELGERLEAAVSREVSEETGLLITDVAAYVGSFDYLSGGGRSSRQFNFTVTVESVAPIVLTEHDSYAWANLAGELPVTAAVQSVLEKYRDTWPEMP